MIKKMYSIFKDTNDYVIVQKKANRQIAMENDLPKAKYIRITKGKDHNLSMYDEDMNKIGCSVNWGYSGYSLISSDFNKFITELVNGLYTDYGIVIERNLSGTPVLRGGLGVDGKFYSF